MSNSGWSRAAYGLAVIALIAVALWIGQFVRTAGLLVELPLKSPEDCSKIKGFNGPEDIVIDPANQLAYATRADRFAVMQEGGPPLGGIDRLDLNDSGSRPHTLTPLEPDSFFPHGLDLWIGPDGVGRLFAINHGADGRTHSVEIFILSPLGDLIHDKTVRSPLLTDPNDIFATGTDSFYVTNTHGSSSAFGRFLEDYAMIPRASIVYHDGHGMVEVLDGLSLANGIAGDRERGILFVGETTGRRVQAYAIHGPGRLLGPLWSLPLPMGVDNLSLAPDGALWAAGHPKLLQTSARMRARTRIAASAVIRIDWQEKSRPSYEIVYQNSGYEMTAASVAIEHDNTLYIGATFGNDVLRCVLDDPQPPANNLISES